jgi:hypothetical protein
MRVTTAAGFGAAGLTLAGVVTIVAIRVSTVRDRSNRNEKEIDKLRSQVASIQQSTRMAPFLVRPFHPPDESGGPTAAEDAAVSNAAKPPPPEQAPAVTPEERDYQVGVVIAAHRQLLEDSYAQEASDPGWSRSALASLQTVYSGESFKNMTLSSECRATICRVTFAYGEGPGVDWRDMMGRVPWPASSRGVFDEVNRRGVFYVPREGHELPEPDPATLIF